MTNFTHTTISPELIASIINSRAPLTHLVAGTSLGKTFHTTTTDRDVLFVTPLNVIKSQTDVLGGQTYTVKTLIEAFTAENKLRGVVSAEALLMAYESYTFGHTAIASFNRYFANAVDSVVLDEFHLYVTEATYRPALGELLSVLTTAEAPILTLTATPIHTLKDDGDVHTITTTKTNVADVTMLVLPTDAGTQEVTKEMTSKAYNKAGLTNGTLLDNGKYEVTTTKKIQTPSGFAKAQKLNTLSLIAEDHLNSTRTGLLVLSEESKAVSREMVAQLNATYPELDMLMLDRDLFDMGTQAKEDMENLIANFLAPESAMQDVYAEYPFLTLYDKEQKLNRPLMMTKFGSAGMNILDDVDNATVVMMAGSVVRNIANETKLQVVGRFRNAKNVKVYDMISGKSEAPEAKRNTVKMIKKIGVNAVAVASPFKNGINTILKANTDFTFKKACLDYADSLGDITINSINGLWRTQTSNVNMIKLDAKLEGFETQSSNIVKEVLKVSKKVAVYPQLMELYTDVVKVTIDTEDIVSHKEVSDTKIDTVLTYFPMIARLVALEVFDTLKATWAEQIAHTKATNELLNPLAKWSEIVQYKVRNAYADETNQEAIETVIAQLTPMNISKLPKRQLALIASVLPTEYANVVLGDAKFTEKKEVINIWINGCNDKSQRIRHYDFNEFVTLEAINEKVLVGKVDFKAELDVVAINIPKTVEEAQSDIDNEMDSNPFELDDEVTIKPIKTISNRTMIIAISGALMNPRCSETVRKAMEARLADSNQEVRDGVADILAK